VPALNPDADAVHLLVLAAGLIIVGALAVITWRYRGRPSIDPPPATPGLTEEAEMSAAMRRELRTQVAFLSSVLNELPPAESSRITEAMLNGDDLRDFSFARFRTLAAEIDSESDAAAAVVETNLRWLGDLIRQIRTVRSGIHYDWSQFPRVKYTQMVRNTRRPLREMAEHLEPPDKTPT
jgi:hypothetical protein